MNRKERRAAKSNPGAAPSPRLIAEIDRLMVSAGDWQRQGKLREAASTYQRVVALAPNIPEAHINLGIVLQGLGQVDEAITALRRATTLAPDMTVAHNNLGTALKAAGRLTEAVESYRQSLAHQPDAPLSLTNLALALLDLDRAGEAAECCRRALAANPAWPDAHFALGNALRRMGRTAEAAHAFRSAIALRPGDGEAWLNLGNALAILDRPDEALDAYRRVLALRPDHAEALANLGALLQTMARCEDALAVLSRAIALKPDHAQAHNNLGAVLQSLGRLDEALDCYRRALALDPQSAEAEINLAEAAFDDGRSEEAEGRSRRAVALSPGNPVVLNNFGNMLDRRGNADQAIAAFERAIASKPDYADTHVNYAMALLRQGRLREGWKEFEWRRRTASYLAAKADFPQPEWAGESLEGKSILLHGEQGLGDVIQFARFAPMIAALGAHVVLWVHPPLARLLRTTPEVADVLGFDRQPPATDFHLPLISAPCRLDLGLGDIPAQTPYLHPDVSAAAEWKRRLEAHPGKKVGLVWSGAPRPYDRQSHLMDRRRSLRLDRFGGLAAVPGLTFVSLQKGEAAAQAKAPPEGMTLLDPMEAMEDFADTAALVANLDLVISVDTSVAHLAGALGVPVWILSRFDGCWRWLENRDDSPWYPTARLFRQPRPGDWDDVLGRVAEALRQLA